jgi:hypothetical protein
VKSQIKKNMSLWKKKKKTNWNESLKFKLIFQIENSWNLILGFNQETQFSINLMLKDEIKNKKI